MKTTYPSYLSQLAPWGAGFSRLSIVANTSHHNTLSYCRSLRVERLGVFNTGVLDLFIGKLHSYMPANQFSGRI